MTEAELHPPQLRNQTMTDSLPAPLTPHDCDLRDFAFMPLDVVRLFSSEFHATATDAEWRAGVTLWCKAWHQVPAASLPDDDIALARLAELGRDYKTWARVKAKAIRGWVKCSDGRLYHRVVAEKALEAWIEKLGQRKSSGAGNAKRWKIDFDPSEINAAIRVAAGMLASLSPQSRTLHKRTAVTASGTAAGTPDGNADGTPEDIPSGSQGTGTGTLKKDPLTPPKGRNDEPEGFPEWYEAYPRKVGRIAAASAYWTALKRPGLRGNCCCRR
jgi:hypothetical protein